MAKNQLMEFSNSIIRLINSIDGLINGINRLFDGINRVINGITRFSGINIAQGLGPGWGGAPRALGGRAPQPLVSRVMPSINRVIN